MINEEDEPYFYQVDGEPIDTLPVTYECLPEAHDFIKPKEDEVLIEFNKKHKKEINKGKIPNYPHCV